MTFHGFTLPDGAYLPPELIYLLPNISEAKLKILIAVIYHNTQIGGGEPLSLTDIERITGLSRQSVVKALTDLLETDQMLDRIAVGNSYAYLPRVKASQMVKNLDHLPQVVKNLDYPSGEKVVKNLDYSNGVKLRESDSELNDSDSLTDSLNSSENGLNSKLDVIRRLRAIGVYLKTAQDIVRRHEQAKIDQHLAYYQYAMDKRLAQGPGWFVMSINEDWPAPLGYESPDAEENRRNKYAEWDSRRR